MNPFIVLDPVEVPGWGQVPGEVVQDEVTRAAFALAESGPLVAARYIPLLKELVSRKTWRSAAAVDVLLQIQRQLAAAEGVRLPEKVR